MGREAHSIKLLRIVFIINPLPLRSMEQAHYDIIYFPPGCNNRSGANKLIPVSCNTLHFGIQNLFSNIIHSENKSQFYIKYFLFINQSPLIMLMMTSN